MSKKTDMSYLYSSPVLLGNNTIPGVKIPKELEAVLPTVFKVCTDFGLDYPPTYVQKLTWDEISEIAAYGGFPTRYPHWSFGMEFEELQHGYIHGMQRIYEMVINSTPSVIYCLDSNSLLDDVTVVAHALGHGDFFKNNIFFSQTNQNMINQMANHGTRIRKYMARWGKERVMSFLDTVLMIQTLIDPANAWEKKKVKQPVLHDQRQYEHPHRLPVTADHEYMEEYINPKEWTRKQQERIARKEKATEIGIFKEPTKDIVRYIRDHAPLQIWQADIVAMIYEESMYFSPQRMTKTINEGWASWCDYNIIVKEGLAGLGQKSPDCGIIDYAIHKMGVLGGKYSMNPYKLGFELLCDIESRWNKGRFGQEYDDCDNMEEREKWDKNLGLGKEKVFEVRKFYNDYMLIDEFFTPEFCEENEFFEWKKYPNGEYRIENRDPKKIKKKLLQKYLNGGLPEIKIVDPNHRNKGYMLLEHSWEGRTLHKSYALDVMTALHKLWGNKIVLSTRTRDGDEIVFMTTGNRPEDVLTMSRQEYEENI